MNRPLSNQPDTSQPDSSQALLPLKGLHILLAEDCIDQGRLYLHILQKAGAKVTLECNGLAAVDAVINSPTLFDVVVMDFDMPEMDGLHATWKLREICYSGPIIAITAYGSEELRGSWYTAGCSDFLEKPISKDILLSAVQLATAVNEPV